MYAFHEKHCNKLKTFIVNHVETVLCSTIFQILTSKEDIISPERHSGSGRPAKIISEPCITPSGLAINVDFKDNCLAKILGL